MPGLNTARALRNASVKWALKNNFQQVICSPKPK